MKKILFALLTFGVMLYGAGKYLNYKVDHFVINISKSLSQELGHPVSIAKVSNKWHWLNLKIKIDDLVINDKDTNIPLFMSGAVVATVDGIESILNLGIRFKHLLLVNPRLVIEVKELKTPQILGLSGQKINTMLDLRSVMALLASQPRISVQNGDFHLQGLNKADLPFMRVNLDFSESRQNEYKVIARGMIAAADPTEFNFALNYLGEISNFSQALIDFELKTSKVKIGELLNFIPSLAHLNFAGDFHDMDFNGAIQNGNLRSLRTDFSVNQLKIAQHTVIANTLGTFEYSQSRDKYFLELRDLQLDSPNLFTKPLHFKSLKADIFAVQLDQDLTINSDNLSVNLGEINFKAKAKASINNGMLSALDIDSDLGGNSISKLFHLLPDATLNAETNAWLRSALKQGKVEDLKYSYHPNKSFLSMAIRKMRLEFAKDWPAITDIDANLILDGNNFLLETNQAQILASPVNSIVAKYPILDGSGDPILAISGNMPLTLEQGIEYLAQTPLQANIGDKISSLKPSGDAHLDLKLLLNLKRGGFKVNVDGNLNLKQDSLVIPKLDLALNEISGRLNFTNKTLTARNIDLKILGQMAAATIDLDSGKSKDLEINLVAPLHASVLKQFWPSLDLSRVHGTANLSANILIPLEENRTQKSIVITSDLKGVDLDFPEPFNKAANAKWPSTVTYLITDKEQERLNVRLANLFSANLSFSDNKISGGQIFFGPSAGGVIVKDKLHISGHLKQVKIQDWMTFINDESVLSLPIEGEVMVDKLFLHEKAFDKVMLSYDSKNSKIGFDNSFAKGNVKFNKNDNKYDIRLDRLDLSENKDKDNQLISYLKGRKKDGELPLVQFYCENLKFKNKDYRKVSLQLLPRVYGYEIMEFSAANDNALIQAQGQWEMGNKEFTLLSGNSYSNNFGNTLTDWGYSNSVTKGNGELNFSLQWNGDPGKFDWKQLDGALHLELRSGSLNGVNPGLGRIVGLLSFESIQRRLQLDFSDLISKGFAFDKLTSDIRLRPGIASSDNILINGPAARIELAGKTDLNTQSLDFTMLVTPKVGTTIPVAAAIAIGNPAVGAVGAALWLFDKASGSKISEITRYRYNVSGTWTAPKIEEVVVNK